jgi:hypothetical protein
MRFSYFTDTGEKLYLDGYEWINIKFSCQKRKGAITSAVQEIRIVKIIYCYYCEHPVGWGGGGGFIVCIYWCCSSLPTFRDRSRTYNMNTRDGFEIIIRYMHYGCVSYWRRHLCFSQNLWICAVSQSSSLAGMWWRAELRLPRALQFS